MDLDNQSNEMVNSLVSFESINNNQQTTSKYQSRFANIYGMCSDEPEYINIDFHGPDDPYYRRKKRVDIPAAIGVLLITAAVVSAILLALIPLYLLYNLIMYEHQTEMAIVTKLKKFSPVMQRNN